MALTRTWSAQIVNQSLNVTTLDLWHADVLYQFKRFLTGANPAVAAGAWTITMSSNGTTAGASDNWNSVSDFVWGADNGSAHSWAVFKSPSGFMPGGAFVYMLVSCCSNLTQNIRIYSSGAPWTGGSNLNDPVNVNDVARLSGSVTFQLQNTVLPAASSWHGTRNTVGDFMFFVSKNGQGYAAMQFCGFSLGNAQTLDGFPFLFTANFYEGSDAVGAGGLRRNFLDCGSARATMLWKAGQGMGIIGGDNLAGTGVMMPRNTNDSITFLNTAGIDAIDATKIIAWPCHVITTGTAYAYRGRIIDVDMAGQIAQLTSEPAGTQERCFIGGFLVPFSTSPIF